MTITLTPAQQKWLEARNRRRAIRLGRGGGARGRGRFDASRAPGSLLDQALSRRGPRLAGARRGGHSRRVQCPSRETAERAGLTVAVVRLSKIAQADFDEIVD